MDPLLIHWFSVADGGMQTKGGGVGEKNPEVHSEGLGYTPFLCFFQFRRVEPWGTVSVSFAHWWFLVGGSGSESPMSWMDLLPEPILDHACRRQVGYQQRRLRQQKDRKNEKKKKKGRN
jgi:hypothetical protein